MCDGSAHLAAEVGVGRHTPGCVNHQSTMWEAWLVLDPPRCVPQCIGSRIKIKPNQLRESFESMECSEHGGGSQRGFAGHFDVQRVASVITKLRVILSKRLNGHV